MQCQKKKFRIKKIYIKKTKNYYSYTKIEIKTIKYTFVNHKKNYKKTSKNVKV